MRCAFSTPALLRAALAAALAVPSPVPAGGPLFVGGPSFGTDGQFIVWDVATPVPYRIDGGPLS